MADKKQAVAWSSAETDFRALAHGICEALWMKYLLSES